jgi:RNA polymerase sigma factor (sigma-70 family)
MDTAVMSAAIMPLMTETADETLMKRYARGDAAAFDELYRRHELKVWRFIQRSVANRASADELMQEVWFSVARQAPRYVPTAKFTTWLFTLARHRVIDAHRMQRPHDSIDEPQMHTPQLAEQLSTSPAENPASQLQAWQEREALIGAVQRLPAEQREAFLLQAEAELSVAEIAKATGVNFETAKSRLRYARAALKTMLQELA